MGKLFLDLVVLSTDPSYSERLIKLHKLTILPVYVCYQMGRTHSNHLMRNNNIESTAHLRLLFLVPNISA